MEIFQQPVAYLESEGHKICYTKLVEVLGQSLWKTERVVIVTDRSLALFAPKGNKPKDLFLWQLITGLTINNEAVYIKFGDQTFGLKTLEYASLFGAISDTIQRVLTKNEINCIGLYDFQVQRCSPNPLSMYTRLTNLISIKKITILPESLSKINEILRFSNPEIDLSYFHDIHLIYPIIVDFLSVNHNIQTVIISNCSNISAYRLATELITVKTLFSHLVIDSPITPEFDTFLDTLSSSKSKLIGLTLKGCSLNDNHLQNISKAFSSKSMYSLGFKGCIEAGSLSFLYSSFLKSSISKSLTSLNLDHSTNINLSLLLRSIPYLLILSVSHCNLEISSVFRSIYEAPLVRLHALNMSGNVARSIIDDFRSIPSSLVSITADDVCWSEGSFSSFIRTCLKSFTSGFKLSVARSQCTTDEWCKIFNFLSQSSLSSLSSLVWDENPAPPKFFDFLRLNHRIEYLSISNTFHHTYPEPISHLVSYLSKSPFLKYFICRGSISQHLGPLTVNVINSMRNNNLIELIDITENHSGDAGISTLPYLIDPNRRRILICDGTYPTNYENFASFVSLSNSHNHLKLSYPENDINYIRSNQYATEEQLQVLINTFKKGSKPRKLTNSIYTPPARSVFDEPYSIFLNYHNNRFPEFLPKKTLVELSTQHKNRIFYSNNPIDSKITEKKLENRMMQARQFLLGENIDLIPEAESSMSEIKNFLPDNVSSIRTATPPSSEHLSPPPSSHSINRHHSHIRTRGTEEPDLPYPSESHISTKRSIENISINQTPSNTRSPNKISRKIQPALVIDWKFPAIKLSVNYNELWDMYEEDFSLQNVFELINVEKK